jgi:hypothetical protein
MRTPSILRDLRVFKIIIIYIIFLEFIDNEKLEEDGGVNDNVYTMHI